MGYKDSADYRAESGKRLKKIVVGKQRTTMIGCLERIEQFLGFLWGDEKYKTKEFTEDNEFGLDINKLIEEIDNDIKKNKDLEIKFKLIWQVLRSTILNLGNSNIRDTEKEVDMYDISWNRYTMKLPVKPRGQSHD